MTKEKRPAAANCEALEKKSDNQPDFSSARLPAFQVKFFLPQVARAAERDRLARYLLGLPPRLEDLEVRS